MNKFFFASFITILFFSCKNQYLTGYYTREQFIEKCEWKVNVNEKYKPDPIYLDSLKSLKDSIDVKLFLGTWCSDSRKLIPKFFKIQNDLKISDLQIVSVDTTKKDEKGWYKTYAIDSIPMFIFYKKDETKEIGRLKVKPYKKKLEKNLFEILKK